MFFVNNIIKKINFEKVKCDGSSHIIIIVFANIVFSSTLIEYLKKNEDSEIKNENQSIMISRIYTFLNL